MDVVKENAEKQPEVIKPKLPPKHEPSQTKEPRQIPKRTIKSLNTPSIKDALAGKTSENEVSAKEQHQMYAANDEAEEFTSAELEQKWKSFLSRLEDRPSLQSTLSYVPEIKEDFQLYLEIENSVQEDAINLIKPDLVSWLRKELRNSKITLVTKISEKTRGRIIYTDEEKYTEMLKKNPSLAVLKKKFNLDFGN